ncbi:MAG: glycosyltransferase family 2 protein [Elusimicrobiales bacterium]|nr:glycosyltransferase family 2 protein [Elusimicrobiales bacterium]
MSSEAGARDGLFCSIVLPCYNEAGNLPELLAGFAAGIPADMELVLVDNASTDGTAELLRREAPKHPFLRIVSVEVNRGYGAGILSGLAAARGAVLGWAHGDLQYSPADILAAAESLRPLAGGKVFLKGLRSNRSAADVFFTGAMALFASAALGLRLRDINAQPTFFSRELFEGWADPPGDFSLDLFAYADALRRGYQAVRRPVRLAPRPHGSSSWNRGLADRLRLSWRMTGAVLGTRARLRAGRAGA